MQGLALTPDDAWSVHSVAHVYEMKAEVDNGLKFMESREKDWQVLIIIIINCVFLHRLPIDVQNPLSLNQTGCRKRYLKYVTSIAGI